LLQSCRSRFGAAVVRIAPFPDVSRGFQFDPKRTLPVHNAHGPVSALLRHIYADVGRNFTKVLGKVYGLGDPVADRQSWRSAFPALKGNVPIPPMLMQLPESEARWSMELFRRLQAKTAVELYVFPDAAHVKSQPRQLLAASTRNLAWFRWLQRETGAK
jgi:hypothetical protein